MINSKKYVKICPKCASTDIKTDFSNPVVWAYGTSPKYRCSSCGYIGSLFPEVLENEIKNYKKELQKSLKEHRIKPENENLVDNSAGFSIGIFEFITFVIGLILTLMVSLFQGIDSIIPLILWIIISAYAAWILIKRFVRK